MKATLLVEPIEQSASVPAHSVFGNGTSLPFCQVTLVWQYETH